MGASVLPDPPRNLHAEAEFVFVADPAEVPADATPFDMRGVELGHHAGDCSSTRSTVVSPVSCRWEPATMPSVPIQGPPDPDSEVMVAPPHLAAPMPVGQTCRAGITRRCYGLLHIPGADDHCNITVLTVRVR